MNNIEIAKRLINKFNKKNKKLYLVGGSVRDYLLFNDFNDFDFATPLSPDQVIYFLKLKTYDKFAASFGTIKFTYYKKNIEITSFRKEDDYKDNRHPSNISFIDDMSIDSNRRDFTINALYIDLDKVYDFHNGLEDLKNKILKCIGNVDTKFKSDNLRIIRAIRFSNDLDLKLDKKIEDFIINNKELVKQISKYKLTQELNKFKKQDYISAFKKYCLYKYISDIIIEKV